MRIGLVHETVVRFFPVSTRAAAMALAVIGFGASGQVSAHATDQCSASQAGYFDLKSSPPPVKEFERTPILDLPYSRDKLVTVHIKQRSLTGKDTVFVEFFRSDPNQGGKVTKFKTWEPKPYSGSPRPDSFTTVAAKVQIALRKGFGVYAKGCLFIVE